MVRLRGRAFTVADDKPTFWAKAEAGLWEPETLEALEALAGPGDAVLDIGAWVGPTALFSAALGARVVAVEADPRAQALLAGNLAANPELAERVALVPRAAAAAPGPVRLGSPRKRGDSMSSVLHAGRDNAWEVEAITPAELVALLPPHRALVVKIDIEGGEYDLLPALAPALPPSAGALLVAFHPGNLAEAGLSPEAIRERTRAVFAALAAYAPAPLGGAAEAPEFLVERVSRVGDTVVFRRHPGSRE